MLAKIAIGTAALLLPIMIGHSMSSAVDALFGSSSNTSSTTADCTKPIADIAPVYCQLYYDAQTHVHAPEPAILGPPVRYAQQGYKQLNSYPVTRSAHCRGVSSQ